MLETISFPPKNAADSAGVFECQCGRPIFFRNSLCLGCGSALGYDPVSGRLMPLQPASSGNQWTEIGNDTQSYRRCANLETPAGCNWLIPVHDEEAPIELCICCRLNRTIPDLSVAGNGELWHRIEIAKRHLVACILSLKLPVVPQSEDPKGLAFDLLRPTEAQPQVMTGHDNGLITLNVEEADDAVREKHRTELHEPYRTLLGHLRHESGHYYWDRLVDNTPWLEGFRSQFGDDTQDYGEALKLHFQNGPPANWQEHFVSAYATSHPWEDWAETWAHYLHMTDTLLTARALRLDIHADDIPFEEFDTNALARPEAADAQLFLTLINSWVQMTAVLNELSRSMGVADFYPFVLSRDAVSKLHFVHSVIAGNATVMAST